MYTLEDDNIKLRDSLVSMRESLEKSRNAFVEECKHTESLKHVLDEEHKKTRALDHKLKRKKGGKMCLDSASPHYSSCVEPGARPSSWPDNTVLIDQMEPLTMTTVVADNVPWQLDSITIEDWSDEEVTTPKPALSKQRMQRGFSPLEPQKGFLISLRGSTRITWNMFQVTPS